MFQKCFFFRFVVFDLVSVGSFPVFSIEILFFSNIFLAFLLSLNFIFILKLMKVCNLSYYQFGFLIAVLNIYLSNLYLSFELMV